MDQAMRCQLEWFFANNKYRIPLLLTGILAYGFSIVQPSIGNDDTAIPYYYLEGQDVRMGRWTLFVLNKVFHFAEYAPYFLELIGLLLLMLGATLFCVLFRRITEEDDCWSYTIFSCVFISSPIICEINYYYTHNGVDLSFCCIALALLAFDNLVTGGQNVKNKVLILASNLLLVGVVIGCCESMIIVYAIGILMVCYLRKQKESDQLSWKRIVLLGFAVGSICVVNVALRGLIKDFMVWAFDLYEAGDATDWRSAGEGISRIFEPEGFAELKMLIKRFWLVYHVNAFVYLPILAYAAACLVVFWDAAVLMIRRRSLWYPLFWLGMYMAPFVLVLAEWKVPAYRSAQFLPIFAGFGTFILYRAVRGKWESIWRKVILACALILVYNQAEYMNRCFYIEHMIYQSNRDVLSEVAVELQRNYDSSLPVVFRGKNETPEVFSNHYVAPFHSPGYKMVALVSGIVDEELKEKYFVWSGYNYGVEIYSDFFTYGYAAFHNNSEQITIFLNYLGYSFRPLTDKELLAEADAKWQDMPSWPAEGSIQEFDRYILIRLGNQ